LEKQALKRELLERLGSELEVLERAQRAAAEAATHEEAKPENSKDTRAIEQSYLARGQAKRIEELRESLGELRSMTVRSFRDDQPISVGALVTIEEEGTARRYFLAPQGGGTAICSGEVQVITPKAPLGRALMGKTAGDGCEVTIAGRTREIAIVKVE
jgi:transcription elongation GreA/GreB family factor